MKTGGRWGFRGRRSRARRSEALEDGVTPLCPTGHLPLKGEISRKHYRHFIHKR